MFFSLQEKEHGISKTSPNSTRIHKLVCKKKKKKKKREGHWGCRNTKAMPKLVCVAGGFERVNVKTQKRAIGTY